MNGFKADCGHDIPALPAGYAGGSGYATWRDTGKTSCYPCTDDIARAELATAKSFLGYLSSDSRTVTTWTGGHLATVTSVHSAEVGFGYKTRRYYIRAVDASGAEWYGTGQGAGMCANMRRANSRRKAR